MRVKIQFAVIIFVFIFLAYTIDVSLVVKEITSYSISAVLVTELLYFIGFFISSIRWHFLMDYKISLLRSIEATLLGLGVNNFTPAKLGEVVKLMFLKKSDSLAMSYTLPRMLIERLSDIVILVGLFAVLSFSYEVIRIEYMYSILILFMLIVISIAFLPKHLLRFLKNYMPYSVVKFSFKILYSFQQINGYKFFIVLLYTLVLWFVYYVTIAVFVKYACGFSLDYNQILLLFVVGAVGMSLPGSPGGIGIVQTGYLSIFLLFHIDTQQAMSFAIIFHFLQLLPTTLIALGIMFKKNIRLKEQ